MFLNYNIETDPEILQNC